MTITDERILQSRRSIIKELANWKTWAIVLAVSSFLTFIQPFDTHIMNLPVTWGYWILMVSIGTVAGHLSVHYSYKLADKIPEILRYILISVIVAAIVYPCNAFLLYLLGVGLGVVLSPFHFLTVWVISIGISFFFFMVERSRLAEALSQQAETTQSGLQTFFDRLPIHIKKGEIWALKSEGHYLRVYTSKGDDLILMRLSDAIREVSSLQGVQTHRSWWVSEAGTNSIHKENGGHNFVLLENGVHAPISKARMKHVKELGWA